MPDTFNLNELVLERIRTVEEYDPATKELTGRYTQIEEPNLTTTAQGVDVTDAMGTPIMTFYNAQSGTFSFTNSLFSLDLAASQFGAAKETANEANKHTIPVSEVIQVGENGTVILKYVPVGEAGAEVKYVKVINPNNTFGATYKVSSTAGDGVFTVDAAAKTITLPEGVTGRVFVNYEKESTDSVKITKTTNSIPAVKTLLVHAIFHDPCNKNTVYAGVIRIPRAQIDPSNVALALTAEGKHPAAYILQKPYCDESARLFDIFVSRD